MFLLKNAFSQRMFIVRIEHSHGFLHDDRTVIEFFIHKMDAAA